MGSFCPNGFSNESVHKYNGLKLRCDGTTYVSDEEVSFERHDRYEDEMPTSDGDEQTVSYISENEYIPYSKRPEYNDFSRDPEAKDHTLFGDLAPLPTRNKSHNDYHSYSSDDDNDLKELVCINDVEVRSSPFLHSPFVDSLKAGTVIKVQDTWNKCKCLRIVEPVKGYVSKFDAKGNLLLEGGDLLSLRHGSSISQNVSKRRSGVRRMSIDLEEHLREELGQQRRRSRSYCSDGSDDSN